MNDFDEQPWIGQARGLLDDSAQSLDAPTLSALNRARQTALARRRPRLQRAGWLSAAGLAGTCALLLAVALYRPHAGPAGAPAAQPVETAAEDADDSIDFYQNLEFYAWLDAQDPDTGG